MAEITKTAEKEVRDNSCRGPGVSPSYKKTPKIGGLGGLSRLFQQSLTVDMRIHAE